MTDLQAETAELPSLAAAQDGFKPSQAFRPMAFSFFVNGLCPYLLYRYLQPKFPAESLQPLLYASIFPVLGLLYGIARKRTLDFIALIALFEISVNVTATLIASNIRWALVARSLTGVLTATAFLTSALIGRPIIHYIARQFASGGDAARQAGFEAVTKAEGGRTFFIATMVWAIAIYGLSAMSVTLALTLEPATYLLVNQVASMTINIALIVWTVRFSRARLMRVVAAGVPVAA
jgi:hypothetical protein